MSKSKPFKFVALANRGQDFTAEDFAGAWAAMNAWVLAALAGKSLTYQELETAIWIETPLDALPIMFYDARDRAIDLGLPVLTE